ncbi:M23 family peptidase [Treponema phagedenis]|uniref:M23 family metallopeptidase n=1 Tax=Treponema phagedenis TaxID=162 RepID=A0A0B7H218_TREPH|nr:M23 family metallopeptidase [Treponema phagedenis]NVP23462.1 M23 family metallopeptidase [Treponema phagedenis]QEJ95229.1 M23 family metallopeptidase [Treponema phagedenis]QEJ98605.1 M23 family metallopeptidase [Treponema phagedenis]QEK01083.1 M23 family metallopeptidase [Treponema phagedenis]QEK04112.1 M23 family metallopeptidase [Treponema phagedenis]
MKKNSYYPVIITVLILGSLFCFTSIIKETSQNPVDEIEGKGGGDLHLPTERPDTQEKTIDLPDLYYTVYEVQQGDMVGTIASKYGISQDAIISVNKLRNTRALQIGQLLKIPSIDGIIYTVQENDTPEKIADTYQISLEKLALVNNVTDNVITPSSVIFLPDAKLNWVTLQEINGDLFRKPLRGGYYISSRYGWRNDPFTGTRSFHNGLDMVSRRGTPVYPALEGKVIATGYSTVYGNYVIIRHHSGYQTLYGHMQTISVSSGRWVDTSTRIGSVGNTGRTTGPHLHFTIYKNGATINPSTMLK